MFAPRSTGVILATALLVTAAVPTEGQRRKKKSEEEITQTLEVLPEPPATHSAVPSRLAFTTTSLIAEGLLSRQTAAALKSLLSITRKQPVVQLRAFGAGTGDMRRIQSVVSEEFTDRHLPVPVLSVIQVGALPLEGAQVQIEATWQQRKNVNPQGLAFLAGPAVTSEQRLPKLAGLAGQALASLRKTADAAGAGSVLRLTCLLSSLDDAGDIRAAAARAFPGAQMLFAQPQRWVNGSSVECEAVARLKTPPAGGLRYLRPAEPGAAPDGTRAVMVKTPELVFAGSQLAFNYTESDARLAFQRLDRSLEAAGTSLKRALMFNMYPLSPLLADLVRKVRFDYLDREHPPAQMLAVVEGLPAMDAAFALDVVALAGQR
jgi:enamine deaminase RidA (YjgF/YER057c/UK114 family)